jgi:hypothetical protein
MQQLAIASSVPAATLPAADQMTREAKLVRGQKIILDLNELRVSRSRSPEDSIRRAENYRILDEVFGAHETEVVYLLIGCGTVTKHIRSFLERKLGDKELEMLEA